MMNKILVPLDGSELSERILVHVQRLLMREDAEVTLFQVIPEDAASQVYSPGQNAIAVARKHVEQLRDTLIANGAQAKSRVVIGDPATKILEEAQRLEPALIAMSTHGRSGLSRFVRGSVAERVLRRAKVPVLLANPTALPERQPLRISKIVVPLDGSEPSAKVLPAAGELAKLFDSELVLFYTIETVAIPDPVVLLSSTMTREQATALLEPFVKRCAGARVRTHVAIGLPATSILDAVKEEKADLVAMTTHGRSGVSRWAFGSTAEHVLRHCPCPLLVKRTSGFLEDAGASATTEQQEPVAASAREGGP